MSLFYSFCFSLHVYLFSTLLVHTSLRSTLLVYSHTPTFFALGDVDGVDVGSIS